MSKDDITIINFKLQETVRFKLFNCAKFVESFDTDSFTQDETILLSHCENYYLQILNMAPS